MELLTNEIRKRMPKLYATTGDRDPVLHVKFFAPWSGRTWWAAEFDGRDVFYGLYERFGTEWCFFSLKELEAIRGPEGLRVARDPDFTSMFASQVDRRLIARNRSGSRGLLPDEIRDRLPRPVPVIDDSNPLFLVKFVTASPSQVWYVSAFDGDDWLYGLIDHERGGMLWCFFSLSDLETDDEPGFGPVERDFEFQPTLASEIIRGKQVTPYLVQSESDIKDGSESLGGLRKRLTAPGPVPLTEGRGILRLPKETGVIFETNEETYDHFLDALPPRYVHGHLFCFAEGDNPLTLFFRRGGQYFVRQLSEAETGELRSLADFAMPGYW